MRLVLDTNVVVSGLLWDGAPRSLLQLARENRVDLITSAPLLAELTNILERDKFTQKIAVSMLTVDELVDRYAALTEMVRPTLTPRIAPDPDDDVVIGTALAATADLIVTGDRALLSVAIYEGMRIVGVADAMQIIG